MSRYRGSPSRSPFRSPARLYETQRDAIIQDQIRLKSAIKAQSDVRRMSDELAMLQIKVRHSNELQAKVQSLIRQNSQLARDNDELSRQLSQRRYQLQRLRAAAAQQHDRQSLRTGQLYQTTKSLELEIDLIKKERAESTRSFQEYIANMQRLLDQKVLQLDTITLKYNDISKQLQLAGIRFEQERNRLKNLMTRTQHELERQLQYTKQKQTSEKFSQIDTLKRNHGAQLALLEDEIAKLKSLNAIKTQQFEAQLNENKNLRRRHQEQARNLSAQNDDLRAKMFKLEQINRSQVQNIQVKYKDYHTQGTSSLKEQHSRQIKLLLDQIDKQKWLINEKNAQIQTLVQQKREQKRNLDQVQLQLGSQIDSLKNKLVAQQQRAAEDNHNLMQRINEITNKALTESQGYHERAKQFRSKLAKLDAEINDKQNLIQKNKKQTQNRQKQLKNQINGLNFSLQKTKRQLSDRQNQLAQVQSAFETHRNKTQQELKKVHAQLNQTQVKLQNSQDKIQRLTEDHSGNQGLLKIQIDSLRNTISVLEKKLSQQQTRHASQMQEFSANLNDKLKKLQTSQRRSIDELQQSKKQQTSSLNLRLQKLARQKQHAEEQLRRYIQMYKDLQKYFKNPHEGALFQQKSKDSIYQVLQKVQKSNIHVF